MCSRVCVFYFPFFAHIADVDETMMSFYFYSRLGHQSVVIVIGYNNKYMDFQYIRSQHIHTDLIL